MKKILLCALLIIVFAFMSSCEPKEDISGNNTQSEIQQNTEQLVESESIPNTEQIIESETDTDTDTEQHENSKHKEFLVVEAGDYHYYSGADHKKEVSLLIEFFEKSDIENEKFITVFGKEFCFEYYDSIESFYYKNNRDTYEFKGEDVSVTVRINSETGLIDEVSYYDRNYLNEKNEEQELSQEACAAIAKSYLSKFTDIDNYELISSTDYGNKERNYKFVRFINGLRTCEQASVTVNAYGDVVGYRFSSLGEMKDATLPTDEEMKIIKENISAKLDAIYSNVSDKYNVSYNEEKVIFSRLSDGRYVLEYTICAKLTPINESTSDTISQEMKETVFLLVYLD